MVGAEEWGEGPGTSDRDEGLVRPIDGWETLGSSSQEYAIEPMSRRGMLRLSW
ncbi:hypothetical protein ACFL3S_05935 [Gemmatimonadota bacterium]